MEGGGEGIGMVMVAEPHRHWRWRWRWRQRQRSRSLLAFFSSLHTHYVDRAEQRKREKMINNEYHKKNPKKLKKRKTNITYHTWTYANVCIRLLK